MFNDEVIIAGFGGQGVLLAGKLLAYAGMLRGFYVTFMPSYGAEVRGGTANCGVVLSGEEIASPVVSRPSTAIVLNEPSMLRFVPLLKPDGLLIANSTMVSAEPGREDITSVSIPATELADGLGTPMVANMIMLGAYASLRRGIPSEVFKDALERVLSKKRQALVAVNHRALDLGGERVEKR